MKAQNTLPIILIALLSASALVTTGTLKETAPAAPAASAAPAVQNPHGEAALLAHHGDHDAVALHDANLHAARHHGAAEVQPESLHVWPDWTPEWELRFVSLNGSAAGVYHATNKLHPEIRFTVTAAPSPSPYDWERAD